MINRILFQQYCSDMIGAVNQQMFCNRKILHGIKEKKRNINMIYCPIS